MPHSIALIGTGIFATEKHQPAIGKISGLELVGCYNRTKSKAEEFAKGKPIHVYDNIDELIKDPKVEAIDALLPVDQNLSIVQKALEAGKPISFEKPIAASLEDAAEIVKLAESTDIPVIVLENWCYHHATNKLKELLPRIGNVNMFDFQVSGPFRVTQYHGTEWRKHPKHIGGFLSDAGVHDIGLITEVLGPVKSVSARAVQNKQESGAVDTLSSLLNMEEKNVFGTYMQSRYSAATRPVLRFQIFGQSGTLIYEKFGQVAGKISLFTGPDSMHMEQEAFYLPDDELNGVVAEFENWKEVLDTKDKTKIIGTPRKAFNHYATIVACVESSNQEGNLMRVRSVE